MSHDSAMNWYLAYRAIDEHLYRPIATLLAILVIIGGIYPILYDGALPHQHLFLGGRPPAGWENHPHDTPLLGRPGVPSETSGATNPAALGMSQSRQLTVARPDQRVVSVYPGPSVLVLTLLALEVVVPAAVIFTPGAVIDRPIPRLIHPIAAEPRPPLPLPPRPSASPGLPLGRLRGAISA